MNLTTKLLAAALAAAALSGCGILVEAPPSAADDKRQCFEDMTAAAEGRISDRGPTDACVRFAHYEMRKRGQS